MTISDCCKFADFRDLDEEYTNLLKIGTKEDAQKLIDWTHMSLKEDLKEGEHFYLISFSLWRQLMTKYNGAPEIYIAITPDTVGEENKLGSPYPKDKGPDLNPVIVKFLDGSTPSNEK